MYQITASDLSVAPRFRPFYSCDVRGYSSALDSLVCPGDFSAHADHPTISLEACRLAGGGYAINFSSSPFEVEHKAEHVGWVDNHVLVMIPIQGGGTIEQDGRKIPFSEGDITFRTTGMPSTLRAVTSCQLLALILPASRFFGIYADLSERFVPSIAKSDSELVRAAREHLAHVFPALPQLAPASAFFAEQSFVSLLAAIYCESIAREGTDSEQGAHDRWQQLATYVEASLCNPELSVEVIARELRISKRLVHRLFEAQNTQYSTYLRTRRLERARGELGNSRLDFLSVGEIAFRNGFADPSHFNRCFRQHFGCPPGAFRKTAA